MTKTYGNFTDFIDFSRASSGTYLGSDGLLKTAADNVPRIEYDSNGVLKGLLIEEQRTNFVTYSEDFSTWALTNCTASSNSEIAPDGNSTADTLSFSSVDGLCRFTGPSCSVGETYTNSIWLKAGTATSIKLVILFSGGGLGLTSSTLSLTNDWQRFDITATVPTGTPDTARFRLQSTEIGTVHVWGAQIEEGSFPTSYIPTSGATATRAADIASISVDNFGYNQKAGTVVVDVNTFDTDYSNWVWVLDGTSDTSLYGHSAASGWRVYGAGGTVNYLGSLPANADAQIGYAYSNVGSATLLDGGSVSTTAHSQPVAVTTVRLGAASTSVGFLNGHIKSLSYRPRRLTNAQLQSLTE